MAEKSVNFHTVFQNSKASLHLCSLMRHWVIQQCSIFTYLTLKYLTYYRVLFIQLQMGVSQMFAFISMAYRLEMFDLFLFKSIAPNFLLFISDVSLDLFPTLIPLLDVNLSVLLILIVLAETIFVKTKSKQLFTLYKQICMYVNLILSRV